MRVRMADAEYDQLRIHRERQLLRLGQRPGGPAAVTRLHRRPHRTTQPLLEQLLKLEAGAALRISAAHREDPVGVLIDVGPILVDRVARTGRWSGHRVASREAKELTGR